MFWFKRNKTENTDLSWLGTDIHSHLIPGIDDGAQDMESSIELIRGLSELGYKKLVTTPHILWEIYPNTPEIIREGLGRVRKAVKKAGIRVEIAAAAEYFIDEYFLEQLEKKAPLLQVSGNMVLVEFSMVTAPLDLQQLLFELQIQNYQPIIAHPERYVYLNRKKEFFDELKASGCMFQVNLMSLTGHYGSAVQELAEYLIKKDYYDYAGTDLHNARHLASLRKAASSPLLKKLKDSGSIKNHLL